MNRADLKQRAKAQLGGSIFGSVWLYAVLVFFINALIQLVGGQIPLLGRVVGLLLTGPLSYGIAKMLLKQSRDGQAMNVAEMFDGFKDDFGGNFLLHLLMSIFIALWSLLCWWCPASSRLWAGPWPTTSRSSTRSTPGSSAWMPALP